MLDGVVGARKVPGDQAVVATVHLDLAEAVDQVVAYWAKVDCLVEHQVDRRVDVDLCSRACVRFCKVVDRLADRLEDRLAVSLQQVDPGAVVLTVLRVAVVTADHRVVPEVDHLAAVIPTTNQDSNRAEAMAAMVVTVQLEARLLRSRLLL